MYFLDMSVYYWVIFEEGGKGVGGGCEELDRDHLSGQILSYFLYCHECALICQLLLIALWVRVRLIFRCVFFWQSVDLCNICFVCLVFAIVPFYLSIYWFIIFIFACYFPGGGLNVVGVGASKIYKDYFF